MSNKRMDKGLARWAVTGTGREVVLLHTWRGREEEDRLPGGLQGALGQALEGGPGRIWTGMEGVRGVASETGRSNGKRALGDLEGFKEGLAGKFREVEILN